MSKNLSHIFAYLCLTLSLLTGYVFAGENPAKRSRREASVDIKVVPWGPTQLQLDIAKARLERSSEVQAFLKGTKHRFLDFEFLEIEDKSGPTKPPTRFRAVFYDYTNDRSIVAESDFAGNEPIDVREEFRNANPNDEEFNEAVAFLKADKKFALLFENGGVKAYRPMPPTTILDGTIERLVNVGIDAGGGSAQNEIVSVSMKRGEVIRYPENAPPSSRATPNACGIPDAGEPSTSAGTAGQYQMTVTQGSVTLWEMLILRPAASSGSSFKRSGIEVRDVKYKGKSVLKRGHVPILNVQYTGGQCGPYRDWQYQEDNFQTPTTGNTDPGPGIRLLADGQIATTALESGIDAGNFRGVAVYRQDVGFGTETVLVTELQAGWYRYIMEWRFAPDGTIRPRFGFGATNDSCVCFDHNHHAYWRLDFDIVQPNNKVFQVERGRKFLQPITTERFQNKNVQTNRSLLIQSSTGDEAYNLIPGPRDGVVDTFGVHDMWVLRYKNVVGGTSFQNEIDDGITCVTCSNAFIQIDPFINGESVVNQDVVVWYGAHLLHDDDEALGVTNRRPEVLGTYRVVGPNIRPVRW